MRPLSVHSPAVAALRETSGTAGTDTVTGFTQGQDLIFFSGQSNSPGGTRDQVIAAQQHPSANTTVLTFPDGTTMTLVGITNVDQTFFK